MAKGRLPATKRHTHDWNYNDALFFSEDEQAVFVTRFCRGCGTRELGDVGWRTPDGDELKVILREEARRDANPRHDLDAAYERGYLECLNQARSALHALDPAPVQPEKKKR